MHQPDVGLSPGDKWQNAQPIGPLRYTCGFCGNFVGSTEGYYSSPGPGHSGQQAFIRICPTCLAPSFFSPTGLIFPTCPPGRAIQRLPADVQVLYEEARASAGAGAHTPAVLTCRKILMHVAVQEKAETDKNFQYYVEYLASHGFVPPNGRSWVDYIRTRANEANHEILLMSSQDSTALITFVEMLLRFIYEFPGMVPTQTTPP